MKILLLLLAATALLAGCAIGPDKQDAPTAFDFGPPRSLAAAAVPLKATLLVPPVAATPWLDSPNIYYRTVRDNGRTNAYAQHQWTQSPATLFTERLRTRLAAAGSVVTPLDGARADYALRVELEDFSQLFNGTQSSQAVVRVRASLIDSTTRALRAQKTFTAERAAPPNAPGAAQALAAAADSVIEDLAAWTAETLK